MDKKRG